MLQLLSKLIKLILLFYFKIYYLLLDFISIFLYLLFSNFLNISYIFYSFFMHKFLSKINGDNYIFAVACSYFDLFSITYFCSSFYYSINFSFNLFFYNIYFFLSFYLFNFFVFYSSICLYFLSISSCFKKCLYFKFLFYKF